MAVDSASDILAFKKQGTGNNLNTWGDELNNALDRISEAIADRTVKSLTGNYPLTSTNYVANESRSAVLVFSDGGLSSTPTVTLPARKKLYWAKNTGSTYGVTLEVSGGTSVTIPAGGRWVFVLCDGTDCEIHDPSVSDLKAPSAALAMNSQKITGLADPTSAQDAATKTYVDTEVATVVSDAGAAAAASASAAATSASNASTSETNAGNSASAASTSATNASNSATAAASSATSAASSATDAANSAASAADRVSKTGDTMSGALIMADNLITRALFKDFGLEVSAIGNVGATRTFDITNANWFTATVDQASTFTFSNPTASGDACVFYIQLTNGGAFTITWPGAVSWDAAAAPTLQASGVDVLAFVTTDAGTTWRGFPVWQAA